MQAQIVPEEPAERRAWIRYQLARKGLTLADLSRKQGLHRNVAAAALSRPYPRMERVIARAIGLSPQTIWPERYDSHGRPNRKPGRPTTAGSKSHECNTHRTEGRA